VRLLDRLVRRGTGYWEGVASGAAVLTTSYGSPDREQILPQFVSMAQQAYGGNSVVFSAILARIMLFSEVTFQFRSVIDKKLIGNTDLGKLETPWPNGTTGELLARMEQDNSLAGNAYVWDAGEQLVRLRPDWVTIVSELVTDAIGREYRRPIGYWWEPPRNVVGQGEPTLFLVDEVAHWSPVPDPCANFRGMSWLTPVIREITADSGMTEYKVKYLDNAATPNLLIKYSQKLRDDTVDRIRDRVTARHGGVDNAFKTLVLDEGADATVIGSNFDQMEFQEVQAAGENRICAAAGVDPSLLGLLHMSRGGADYASAMRRLVDMTMRPLWRTACASLEHLVPPPKAHRLWFDVSDIAALRQGETERAQTMLVQAQTAAVFIQAGFERRSVQDAVSSGELGQLVPAPNAPGAGGAAAGAQAPGQLPQPSPHPASSASQIRLPTSTGTSQSALTGTTAHANGSK
jgi:phage portal protein BeeE